MAWSKRWTSSVRNPPPSVPLLLISRCLLFVALSTLSGYTLTLENLEESYDQKLSDVHLEKEAADSGG